MSIKLQHTTTADDIRFALDTLREAFPDDERRTDDATIALLANPQYSLRLIVRDGTKVGVIAVWVFERFRFVEHLATRPAERGHGTGAETIRLIVAESTLPTVLEVEPPTTETARRRIAFYRRQGFRLSRLPYIQPAYSATQKALPLRLMTHGLTDNKTLADAAAEIRLKVYGA